MSKSLVIRISVFCDVQYQSKVWTHLLIQGFFCIFFGQKVSGFLQCYVVFAMLWKKAVLETVLICSSKERSGSRVTPRSFTVLFEMIVQPWRSIVRSNRRSLCFLGPRTNISVLSEFKSQTFVYTSLCLKHRLPRRAILGLHHVSSKCTAVCHPHSSES